jgi:hypothetical protein
VPVVHLSTFSLQDRRILFGPATAPQPSFEVRIREGKSEVRSLPRRLAAVPQQDEEKPGISDPTALGAPSGGRRTDGRGASGKESVSG